MARRIVECIPNFSEGRDIGVVNAIESAIADAADVFILDRHSDADHHRSVITFAGKPHAVAEAAFAGIAKAASLIDLNQHHGEHPRIGATDVVPFVPISGVSMVECVDLARDLGKRVAQELKIPVYLYENAATRPERTNLENIRRGEYETLKTAIREDPERAADFGPTELGPAGATVIGARAPLIAFNVYLTTAEVDVAKRIARAVRRSSGGLRYVKALGLLVEGRAQVSMNLTDYTRTPVARVVELIRREAERYGVTIHHSELVGLIPQAALVDAAQWYTQLDQFEPDQILESRLYDALSSGAEEEPFLGRLAAGTPTPGGGSAAAHAGAMAAALVGMVARLTLGKKKYAEVEARMQEIAERADELRPELQRAERRDAQAFEAVMDAYRMPKGTEPEKEDRAQAVERATHQAAAVPLQVARWAVEAMELAAEVSATGNVNAATDAASGAVMALAALHASGLNVRVNAGGVQDQEAAGGWIEELEDLNTRAVSIFEELRETLATRAGITLPE
jgi:glutamate formiminotransferase/formiminotetrahydrofolate cyclodeaminase